jgi:hypothetical protein
MDEMDFMGALLRARLSPFISKRKHPKIGNVW